MWSLFCPHECPGLNECIGEDFKQLYERYEREDKARRCIPAQQLWFAVIDSQIETGMPYMLFKDACNAKSNQSHSGVIQGSNLCTEIVQYTSLDETAVCNLASISLPKLVKNGAFDFKALCSLAKHLTRNLNLIIDRNFYPVEDAKRYVQNVSRHSKTRHIPLF